MLFCTTFGAKNAPQFCYGRMIWWRTMIWWRLSMSIARWEGCPCPCEAQTARSPCPSEGLNPDPQGCRASAPPLQTWAAQAWTPVGSPRGSRRSHLSKTKTQSRVCDFFFIKGTFEQNLSTSARNGSSLTYLDLIASVWLGAITSVHVIHGAQHVVGCAG